VRGDANVVRLGHGSDLLRFGDATRVGDVRLGNVDTSLLEVRSEVLSGEQPLSELA